VLIDFSYMGIQHFSKLTKVALVAAFLILAASPCFAVSVAELGVSPDEIVEISDNAINGGSAIDVYAGVTQISLNGVTTNGFCIDPFHFSSGSALTYSEVPLADAPKAPPGDSGYTGMGATQALEIEDLWAMNYTTAETNAQTAAGLQIAIWEIVAGTAPGEDFKVYGDTYGASTMIADLAGYTGPAANLIGLTGPGQDYVIQAVPDGGSTVVLLGAGLIGLAGIGYVSRQRSARAGSV
jgi:hypothetical protein